MTYYLCRAFLPPLLIYLYFFTKADKHSSINIIFNRERYQTATYFDNFLQHGTNSRDAKHRAQWRMALNPDLISRCYIRATLGGLPRPRNRPKAELLTSDRCTGSRCGLARRWIA